MESNHNLKRVGQGSSGTDSMIKKPRVNDDQVLRMERKSPIDQNVPDAMAAEKEIEKERAKILKRAYQFAYWYEELRKGNSNDYDSPKRNDEIMFSHPCSAKFKRLIHQKANQNAQWLIHWSPRPTIRHRHVPSLLDLCINVLASNSEAISSLEMVPDWLRQRLANILCDIHKMDIHILDLLFRGSPTRVYIKNGSWMTNRQLVDVLQKSDLQNLRVLQLDFCRQCSFDTIMWSYLARSPNSLPCLGILSLKGAASLSDFTIETLLVSAPLLQSIDLSRCTHLTWIAIRLLANHLSRKLKELYIDYCPGIDAMHCLTSMEKFQHLEVLSVDGIHNVTDEFVTTITAACGRNLKRLNLANCEELTDRCLYAIAKFCPGLRSLNISRVYKLTDLGMCYLADGCKALQSLNLARAGFSDAVVAAFLETSGRSLKELSLNHVREVSFKSAFSLGKFAKNLISLDISWCRLLRDEALGFITDKCSSLKLLKIFGCAQITTSFITGHGNPHLHIVGRSPILYWADDDVGVYGSTASSFCSGDTSIFRK